VTVGHIYDATSGKHLAFFTDAHELFSSLTGKQIGTVKDGVLYDLGENRIGNLTTPGDPRQGGVATEKLVALASAVA
jgi:hypothetical protein